MDRQAFGVTIIAVESPRVLAVGVCQILQLNKITFFHIKTFGMI